MIALEERVEAVEERTDRLETIFGQFMAQTGIALRRIDRSIERIDRSIDRLDRSIERMEAAIVEMKDEGFRDREESARYRTESARDREESARYRTESARDREESVRERREMNKRWGELANKMGTLVEDIVAPSLRRIGREELGCGEERLFAARVTRTRSDNPSLHREFDVLYVGERAVLLNETKSTPRSEDVRAFVDFLGSGEFALYFPEYREMPMVPIFSSLSIHPDLVAYLTRHGVYALAMGDDVMQVLNRAGLASPAVA